jgi:hypothetical protein
MWRAIAIVLVAACADVPAHTAVPRSVLEREDVLSSAGAVRQRRTPLVWRDIVVVSRRQNPLAFLSMFASTPAPAAQAMKPAVDADPEKLVVEAWLELQSNDIAAAIVALRARVEADGGRVISENVQGEGHTPTSAALELRVPPRAARPLVEWLGQHGSITSRRLLATDVSKQLFDLDLALQNLRLEMTRLQELAAKTTSMQETLDLEKEMTRVRGEIERIEGDQRFLLDRVAFATVTVTLTRDVPPTELARARVHPGAHLAMLAVLDHGTRVGGGATLLVARALTVQVDMFPRDDMDSRAVVATIGTAMYSGLFGYGRRAYGNPFLGVRAGYGYISGEHATALEGELGIELVKQHGFIVEATAAAIALLHDRRDDVALHATLGLDVPF